MRMYTLVDNYSNEELTEQINFTDALLLAETYVKSGDTDVRVYQYARKGFARAERWWTAEEFVDTFKFIGNFE